MNRTRRKHSAAFKAKGSHRSAERKGDIIGIIEAIRRPSADDLKMETGISDPAVQRYLRIRHRMKRQRNEKKRYTKR